MSRLLVRVTLVLAALLSALPWNSTPAEAAPPVVVHEPFPSLLQSFILPVDTCAFPVQQLVTGNREAVTIRVDPDGTQHLQVRGIGTVTVVNLITSKSLNLTLSLPIDITLRPDGSQTLIARGQTLIFFTIPPGAPPMPPGVVAGAWLFHGPTVLAQDATGFPTAFSTTGQTTDICAALAN